MENSAPKQMLFEIEDEKIQEYVFTCLGDTDTAKDVLRKLLSYDKLPLCRFLLIRSGAHPKMSAKERSVAIRLGDEYLSIWTSIGTENHGK